MGCHIRLIPVHGRLGAGRLEVQGYLQLYEALSQNKQTDRQTKKERKREREREVETNLKYLFRAGIYI